MNFPTLFTQYHGVLLSHKKQLQTFQFDVDILGEIKKTLVNHPDFFAYTFSKIRIVIPKNLRPNHCIPRNLDSEIEIILSIDDEVVLKKCKENYVEDPILKLTSLNIILNSKQYTSSWHLDKHVRNENNNSTYLHPAYHLTFGGHHMEDQQKEDSDEFGRALIIRSPRIMHPPMELILGLDFIFTHFIPKSELDLVTHRSYIEIIENLKAKIWLPYALSIVKNYCSNVDIDGTRMQFDQDFVASVLSC